MVEKATELNDNTRFAMPVRNLISLVVAVAFGVWAYFGIIERLNKIETNLILVQSDLVKNTEFRIKWPRGDLGTKAHNVLCVTGVLLRLSKPIWHHSYRADVPTQLLHHLD